MDSHSRSASPREQPRPQQRPPSPPSPRLPPAAFDNKAYQHDDADPNHNESFTSNGAQQNGHNKEPNGDSKNLEAVNLELINLTPKNGSLKQKKDVEVDMNGSNPYDEYFVPVNEHRKYMRGEKLYVTADKRGEKGGCKRPLCWTLLALVVAAIIALIALAATGVIFSNSPTPVDPYNVTISSARALSGIGQSQEDHVHEHEQEHEHNHDENQEQHDHKNDQNQDQHDKADDQNQHDHAMDQNQDQVHHIPDEDQNEHNSDQNREQPNHVHDQEHNEHTNDENQPQQGQNDVEHEYHEPVLNQNHEHNQDQEQREHSPDQDPQQHDQSPDQEMTHNDDQIHHSQNADQQDQMNLSTPEIHMPDTQNDEGRDHTVVPVVNDMSMYVPRTVEGELKIDNEQFLNAYDDPESDEYRQFTESFKEALLRALFDRNTLEAGENDIKLEVVQLRPGSIVVKYRINWKPKYEDRPTEDLLNATTLQAKLNNYLANNNRMISIYHVSEDNLIAKPVIDLCKINKNDCQDGCEFDETSLDFICTCPQGLILDMTNLKTCVPYLSHPESKPIQEISDEINKPILITTTIKPMNPQVFENDGRFNWKGIVAETTTETEPDLKFSSPFDERDKNRWDLESTIVHNDTNDEPEAATQQSPEMKISAITESEGRAQTASEVNSTIASINTQNTTNYDIYLKDGSMSDSREEKDGPVLDENHQIHLITKPPVEQEVKEENVTGHNMFPQTDLKANNVTKANTDLKPNNFESSASPYDSEPDIQEGHYADAAFNLDEALGSHQVIKPEEVYTEEPESTTSEEIESKEVSHSIIEPESNVSESNETFNSSETSNAEISNPSETSASLEPHGSAEIMYDKNSETSSPTTTTVNPTTISMPHHDFNGIKETSHEKNDNERDFLTSFSDTNVTTDNTKTETNADDIDDWLSDTLPNDNTTIMIENSGPHIILSKQNITERENNSDSRPLNNLDNGAEVTTISTNNNAIDMNNLLNHLHVDGNTTKDKETQTAEYIPSMVATTENTEINGPVLDKEDFVHEKMNNTNFENDKKQLGFEMPSLITESKGSSLPDLNSNEQEITTESAENSSEIMNHMPQYFLKAMESLNEPQINKTHTNTNISDDAKYVTFDDINMLLNRSSKSMDNLTQDMDNRDSLETSSNGPVDLRNSSSQQNDSEWLSESVTEVKYNEGINTMDKTETTESVKNKVDHIMTHAKDDYEPDYLSKADDSVYMMERDYESEDPRVKRVNTENKDVTVTEFPKEKNTESNLISNVAITTTSEPFTTNSAQTVVIKVATLTTSAPSTTIGEFIYNTSEKNINGLNEASVETTTIHNTSPVALTPEPVLISNEFNNESNLDTVLTASKETSSEPIELTPSTADAPYTENNDTRNIEVPGNNKVNETQVSNLDVTIYEISHDTGNHSLPIAKSASHMSEYEDHETEMNPFLPETENNKNLVKKLQEGHDLELTNMNETQNDNNDEHNFKNMEVHVINNTVSNDANTTKPNISAEMNKTATSDDKTFSKTQNDETINVKKSDISENSEDNNKVLQEKDNNVEVLPISTFLIDTDDLDANKISTSSNSFTDNPVSRYKNFNNENLSVVPITSDIEDENSALDNSKTQSRYELNDISDASKNSDKRTFESANFDDFSNNES